MALQIRICSSDTANKLFAVPFSAELQTTYFGSFGSLVWRLLPAALAQRHAPRARGAHRDIRRVAGLEWLFCGARPAPGQAARGRNPPPTLFPPPPPHPSKPSPSLCPRSPARRTGCAGVRVCFSAIAAGSACHRWVTCGFLSPGK